MLALLLIGFVVAGDEKEEFYKQYDTSFLSKYTIGDDLDPVILVPGMFGSRIDWRNSTSKWKTLWLDILDWITPRVVSWLRDFRVYYDEKTNTYHNKEGVESRPYDFGGVDGIVYLHKHFKTMIEPYLTVVRALEKRGYVVGKNLFGAPYDWRFAHPHQMEINGQAEALKRLIERAVSQTGKKVHLLGHSMGCTFIHQFLTRLVSPEWKEAHIKSFISTSGAYAGVIKPFTFLLSPPKWGVLNVAGKLSYDYLNELASFYFLFPTEAGFSLDHRIAEIEVEGEETIPVTIRNKTWIFTSTNRTKQLAALEGTLPYITQLPPPGVETHLFYSSGQKTLSTLHIKAKKGQKWWEQGNTASEEDGDGTVLLPSLKAPLQWIGKQKQPVVEHYIANQTHISICHNEEYIDTLLGIVSR